MAEIPVTSEESDLISGLLWLLESALAPT